METSTRRSLLLAGLILCLAALPAQAHATILFAGGEDSDFTCVGTCAVTTTSTFYYTGYAREALSMAQNTSGSVPDPPTNLWQSPSFTPQSTLWIHQTLYYTVAGSGSIANGQLMRVLDGATARILVRTTATTGMYKISTRNAAGTITDLVTGSTCLTSGTLHKLDLYIKYAVSGEVTLYCDGVSVADFKGDVTTNSATTLCQYQLGEGYLSGSSGGTTYWSEGIVATATTTSMRLATLAGAANGNTVGWDTGGVTNVNETTLSDATVNAASTTDQLQLYTVGALPAGSFSILDLFLNLRAQVDTTGPQHVQGAVRTGSSNYFSSNLSPLQSQWGFITTHWATNPNTSVAWTTADLGAAGFNIGFYSRN